MRRILAVAAVVTATLALSAPAEASTHHTTEPSASELAHLASIADSHASNGWQSVCRHGSRTTRRAPNFADG